MVGEIVLRGWLEIIYYERGTVGNDGDLFGEQGLESLRDLRE